MSNENQDQEQRKKGLYFVWLLGSGLAIATFATVERLSSPFLRFQEAQLEKVEMHVSAQQAQGILFLMGALLVTSAPFVVRLPIARKLSFSLLALALYLFACLILAALFGEI